MLDQVLVRLLIALIVFSFFDLVIKRLVKKPDTQDLFEILLLALCLIFVVLGKFLPF